MQRGGDCPMHANQIRAGIKSLKAGHPEKASEIFTDIILKDPKNELAWFSLSACTTDLEKKKKCILKVLDINPQHKQAIEILQDVEAKKTIEKYAQKELKPSRAIFWISLLAIVSIITVFSNQDDNKNNLSQNKNLAAQKNSNMPKIGNVYYHSNELEFMSAIGTSQYAWQNYLERLVEEDIAGALNMMANETVISVESGTKVEVLDYPKLSPSVVKIRILSGNYKNIVGYTNPKNLN